MSHQILVGDAGPAIYRILADVMVVVHFAYVLFILLGMALILIGLVFDWGWVRNLWFRAIHLAMIGIVVAESLCGLVCPLTTLEHNLRTNAGQPNDPGSFIGRWAHELLFIDAPGWMFTVCYCLFGGLVLLTMIVAPPRWSRKPTGAKE